MSNSSVLELTHPKWKGRVGIAPTNASFQAFVTAMRLSLGDERTREWLEGLEENGAKTYEKNLPIVEAVAAGEVDVGLVNHYYLYQLGAEVGQDKLVARNHFTAAGDPGSLVNVAGVGILKSSKKAADAGRFVQYLLSAEAQQHFAERNYEYPLVPGVSPIDGLRPLNDVHGPDLDLSDLARQPGTRTADPHRRDAGIGHALGPLDRVAHGIGRRGHVGDVAALDALARAVARAEHDHLARVRDTGDHRRNAKRAHVDRAEHAADAGRGHYSRSSLAALGPVAWGLSCFGFSAAAVLATAAAALASASSLARSGTRR